MRQSGGSYIHCRVIGSSQGTQNAKSLILPKIFLPLILKPRLQRHIMRPITKKSVQTFQKYTMRFEMHTASRTTASEECQLLAARRKGDQVM